MREVVATEVMRLDQWPDHEIIDVSIGPRDQPVVLLWEHLEEWPPTPDPDEDQFPGNTVGRLRQRHPNYRIVHLHRNELRSTQIVGDEGRYFSRVRLLIANTYLLYASRTDRERMQRNAHIFRSDGRLLRSIWIGDGVRDVQSTERWLLWVTYFDEGVVGHGIGSNGALLFNSSGLILFGYNGVAGQHRLPTIADCEAINVISDDEAWLWYYNDYPLVRIVNRHIVSYWPGLRNKAPIAGSDAFAVAGECVLFQGGYDHEDRLYLMPLGPGDSEEVVPLDEAGNRLRFERAMGRGSKLWLQTSQALHVIDAATLVS